MLSMVITLLSLQIIIRFFIITQLLGYLERFSSNFLWVQLQTGGGREERSWRGRRAMSMSDKPPQPIGSPSASAFLPSAGRTGEGGPSAKEGSARRGEWMTSGGWRQHVWDWRVRSTQLGRDRTHSWLRPAFLHKTGLWEKGKIRPK